MSKSRSTFDRHQLLRGNTIYGNHLVYDSGSSLLLARVPDKDLGLLKKDRTSIAEKWDQLDTLSPKKARKRIGDILLRLVAVEVTAVGLRLLTNDVASSLGAGLAVATAVCSRPIFEDIQCHRQSRVIQAIQERQLLLPDRNIPYRLSLSDESDEQTVPVGMGAVTRQPIRDLLKATKGISGITTRKNRNQYTGTVNPYRSARYMIGALDGHEQRERFLVDSWPALTNLNEAYPNRRPPAAHLNSQIYTLTGAIVP